MPAKSVGQELTWIRVLTRSPSVVTSLSSTNSNNIYHARQCSRRWRHRTEPKRQKSLLTWRLHSPDHKWIINCRYQSKRKTKVARERARQRSRTFRQSEWGGLRGESEKSECQRKWGGRPCTLSRGSRSQLIGLRSSWGATVFTMEWRQGGKSERCQNRTEGRPIHASRRGEVGVLESTDRKL